MELIQQIDLLIELQELDSQIYALMNRKTEIPLMLKKLDDSFKEKGQQLKLAEDALKTCLVKQKGKENDLLSEEETIKKCQGQLNQIKTNKEYTAMQHEIEGHKADKSMLEDEVINIMDEAEKKLGEITKVKGILKGEEVNLNTEKTKVNSELKEIETRLSFLNSQRAELASKIDKSVLGKYERILKGKNGLAMVPVRMDSCGGCHLNLPPQVINEIKMKKDIIFCESCARILYIKE